MSIKAACYALEEVERAKGSNAKLKLLQIHDSPQLRFLLETALNPFLNYGVTVDESAVGVEHVSEHDYGIIVQLRKDLCSRVISGNQARSLVSGMCASYDSIVRKWLIRVFNKNLRAGIARGLVSKAYPGLIPSFDLALCNAIGEKEISQKLLPDGDWYASRKIDGVRCVAFIDENYEVTFFSRGGKPFSNMSVVESQLKLLASRYNRCSYVFDGEIYSKAGSWNATISTVHASKSERDASSVLYMIFDMIALDEWLAKATSSFEERYGLLDLCFSEVDREQIPNLQLVEHVFVKDYMEAYTATQQFLKEGFEGSVLKLGSAPYPFKRSSAWLKWKPIITLDCEIIEVIEGRGKYDNSFGAFKVKLLDSDIIANVGSGFSDEDRDLFWQKREQLIGAIVEVEAQEKTEDSLRFPVFLRLREDLL